MAPENRLIEKERSLSALFSNLAKAAEKQQKLELSKDYELLAEGYWETPTDGTTLESLKIAFQEDLDEHYPVVQSEAEKVGDRGALRALKWGQKVTTLQKTLIDRFSAKGEAIFDDAELYVCEACGFIFLGKNPPDICPVCKAPSSRFSRVK